MRVLRVYHAASEPGHGERDAALRHAGVDVTVAGPADWPGATTDRADVLGLAVKRPGDVNRHTYLSPGQLIDLAAGCDLVDLHEEPFSAVTHQLLDALPRSLPVVSYSAQNIDKRWPPPFHQWQRRAFGRLAGIYPCSRQAASVLRGAGFPRQVSVLPLGVDTSVCFPGTLAHDETFTLGLVGRLVPEKGVRDAVAVLRDVARVRPARLFVIGDGPESATATALAAEYGVRDALTLLPWQTPIALAELYRAMHVVLVPSRATRTWVEQFGRVVTEGRACGAVALGYASGSLPEVVGNLGVTVGAGDVAALSAAAVTLAEGAERWRALRQTGLREVPGWDEVARSQLAFYERVLSMAGSRHPVGRAAATAEFGPPASIDGGGRPFALPILRADTAVSRGLAAAIDLLARR